jgi:hypothetical protein
VHKNAMKFCVFILHPDTLPYSFIRPSSFLYSVCVVLSVYIVVMISSENRDNFALYFLTWILFSNCCGSYFK